MTKSITLIGQKWSPSNMDGTRDYHTKWRKSDKDKYHMILLICGIFKKWYKWTYLQNKKQAQRERSYSWWGRDRLGSRHCLFKTDNQQGPTV